MPVRMAGQNVGAAPVNYYVDSVGGNDSNSGLTMAAPFQNLSAVPWANNLRVALKYGSTWFAELSEVALTGVSLIAYGTPSSGLPVIDGTAVVTGWTFSGTANVYQKSVAYDSVLQVADDRLTVYENDVLLARVADIATCSATPGSFVDINGTGPNPVTVQIQSSDSSNPATNGKTYRVTVRDPGIILSDGASISGVRTQRVMNNNGSLALGKQASVSRALAVYGTKHNMLVGSGSLTDVIACGWDGPTSYESTNAPTVWNTPTITGLTLSATRVFVVANGSVQSGVAAFIDHDNGTGHGQLFTGTQLAQIGAQAGWQPTASTITINGLYSSGVTQPGNYVCDAGNFNYLQVTSNNDTGFNQLNSISGTATWTFRNCVFYDAASSNNNALFRLVGSMTGCTLNLINCAFYVGNRACMNAEGMTSGTINVQNCIFCYPAGGSFEGGALNIPSGVTYTGNNNVFLSDTVSDLGLTYQGTTYTTLAAWRAASRQDANSIALASSGLSSLFQGTPAAGNFVLGTSGSGAQAAAIGAGVATHWSWNARAPAFGGPSAWPSVPQTIADAETYVRNPGAWTF